MNLKTCCTNLIKRIVKCQEERQYSAEEISRAVQRGRNEERQILKEYVQHLIHQDPPSRKATILNNFLIEYLEKTGDKS